MIVKEYISDVRFVMITAVVRRQARRLEPRYVEEHADEQTSLAREYGVAQEEK